MTIFVARQPVFDLSSRVAGYELLFRGDAQTTVAAGVDSNTMSARVITNAFLGIGIKELTGGVPAYVNFTRTQLVNGTYELFDRDAVVIELLETVQADDVTVAICRRMVEAGYTLALDDFAYDRSYHPLLQLASIVKVDVLDRPDAELKTLVEQVKPFKVRLLAERVETEAVHARCKAMGFELFQGYFYARPEMMVKEDIESGQMAILRLLNLLRDTNASDDQLDLAFRGDPGLCYKLLRIVNSAATGRSGVESIGHAIRLIGRAALHRWLAVLLAGSFAAQGGTTSELALVALARARLCELMAQSSGNKAAANPMFMTGLFSMMDALMRSPMDRVLSRVEVAPDVRSALLTRTGAQAPSLLLAEAYEKGDFDSANALAGKVGVGPDTVVTLYVEALGWAREQLHTANAA